MFELSLFLFLIFIGSPFSVFMHELGHALAGIVAKTTQTTLYLGTGKKFFRFRCGRICFVVQRFYLFGGYTINERKSPYTTWELVYITASGPLMNGLVALGILFLWNTAANPYLSILFAFNVWLALGNLVPIRLKGKQTDGYTIMEILRKAC